jgi:hypothetical protein
MSDMLLFWNPGPNLRLSPAEVAREIVWGEEVDGLIDLDVRDIIERLKAAFPDHQEQSGQLIGRGTAGTFEATWTWQHVRVDCRDLAGKDRQRLIDTIEAAGCQAYAPGGPNTSP